MSLKHESKTISPSPSHEPEIKCGGIIIDKQRRHILCVLNRMSFLKGEHKWGFPKGHIKPREADWKCAQREIQEETSLYLEKKKFIRSVMIYHNIYYIISLNTEYDNLISRDSKEICQVEWKTLDQLRQHNHNRDLRLFLNFMGKRPLSILNQLNPVSKYNLTETYYKSNVKSNVKSKKNNSLFPAKKKECLIYLDF